MAKWQKTVTCALKECKSQTSHVSRVQLFQRGAVWWSIQEKTLHGLLQ